MYNQIYSAQISASLNCSRYLRLQCIWSHSNKFRIQIQISFAFTLARTAKRTAPSAAYTYKCKWVVHILPSFVWQCFGVSAIKLCMLHKYCTTIYLRVSVDAATQSAFHFWWVCLLSGRICGKAITITTLQFMGWIYHFMLTSRSWPPRARQTMIGIL